MGRVADQLRWLDNGFLTPMLKMGKRHAKHLLTYF